MTGTDLAARSTACIDWEERIVKAQTLIPFAPLFHDNAVEALETFDMLKIMDADPNEDGEPPTFGEVSRPWIREFVAQIFGSYEDATGRRHIRNYFLLISKKNGKSTTAAGIMLTALILNWREYGEFIILSPTIEIAKASYEPAAAMVRADPALSELLSVHDHVREIRHRTTHAVLKVVAADSNTVSGKKAIGVLVDELWLFGKMPNADKMLLEATGGLTSRKEGFVIYLSTQSDEPPAGVFKEKLDYARAVRDGKIHDPKFLPVIYEFPKHMLQRKEYLLQENFYVTNPNFNYDDGNGGSVDREHILSLYREAQQKDESQMRIFLSKHLNVEIGMNLSSDRWPGAEFWEQGAVIPRVTIDYLIENCEVVVGGGDGGGLDDLLGGALIGREKFETEVHVPELVDEETGVIQPAYTALVKRWVAWTHGWAHPSVLDRRKDISSRLEDFARDKTLTLVRRVGDDTLQLARYFKRVYDAGLLHLIGLDPACVGAIVDALLQEGIPEDKIVKVNQGWRLAGAIKTTERKLAESVLVHDGNSMINWCVGNAKCVVKGNAVLITKQISGTAKIDPLMALINCAELMSLNPPAMEVPFDADNLVMA